MNTSLLMQELEPLNAQIEQTREQLRGLEAELRAVEAELDTFAADQQRFDALRDVCDALDRLNDLQAGELFWADVPLDGDAAGHLGRLRERIAGFEEKIQGALEKQESLKVRINQHLADLDDLDEEVRRAHAREERRQEEFVIEREVSPVAFRSMVMPWSKEDESERSFRRALLVSLLLSLVFGALFPLVELPVPDRAKVVEIPERLARLVKKEPPRPEPLAKPKPEPEPEKEPEKPRKKKPESVQDKTEKRPEKKPPQPTPSETQVARKKAESSGVLAFKENFSDLMEETPVAKLGAEARLDKEVSQAKGQARAKRSLVTKQAKGGSSGGISNAAVSRNVGTGNADRLGGGGVGFERVESAVAGLQEEARPVSDGPGPARTDEEIQIVFDRYKAALYRIYNKQLRKNPTLRGEMLFRIVIEPNGAVSECTVKSSDLDSSELEAKIVARIERFNFGPKEGVPRTTILYPIDFLPAG